MAGPVEKGAIQLRGYLGDERLAWRYLGVRFTGLVLVFHGWEMVYCEETPPGAA